MRIICPIILMVVLVALSYATPVKTMFIPREVRRGTSLEQLYENNETYIIADFQDLNFTGYTDEVWGNVRGYYYYTQWENDYAIVLVSPKTCQQGIPHMDSLKSRVKIEPNPKAFDVLFPKIAQDLGWNDTGVRDQMDVCLLSEPAGKSFIMNLSMVVYAIAFIYGAFSFFSYAIYVISPLQSPFCKILGKKSQEIRQKMEEAEIELSDSPQLVSGDVFITENYLVETAETEFCIIPIDKIIWVYRHAGLHFVFGKIRPVREVLYVITKTHGHFRCTALGQGDIDGVIDYLSEANPEILIGLSEENRIKADIIKKEAKQNERVQ
ncbi:MAG: hypothetical protein MJ110_03950 [Lachnospiraceae bacterium]|nr:hypothetical protein [Lachnospiraceae bacterium]